MISLTGQGDICHGVKAAINDSSYMKEPRLLLCNALVKIGTSFADAVRLIRFAALL
jgi:hypothetical protein